MAAALSAATAKLVAKAAVNSGSDDMPTLVSAIMCAGNAARTPIHRHPRRTSKSVESKTIFGGQNGAKILSERVPTKNANSAANKYPKKVRSVICRKYLTSSGDRSAGNALSIQLITAPHHFPALYLFRQTLFAGPYAAFIEICFIKLIPDIIRMWGLSKNYIAPLRQLRVITMARDKM